MSTLSYAAVSDYPFIPYTKIYSSDINSMFSIISTWANGNITATNITPLSLTRYGSTSVLTSGTANFVVYNDSSGNLTEAAVLPTAQGGLGFAPNLAANAGLVLQVNPGGTALTLASTPPPATSTLYNYLNLG